MQVVLIPYRNGFITFIILHRLPPLPSIFRDQNVVLLDKSEFPHQFLVGLLDFQVFIVQNLYFAVYLVYLFIFILDFLIQILHLPNAFPQLCVQSVLFPLQLSH